MGVLSLNKNNQKQSPTSISYDQISNMIVQKNLKEEQEIKQDLVIVDRR
jgi:hypothetical protein